MPLVKVKPTSPGRRSLVKVVASAPAQGPARSVAARAQKRGAGRNNNGHITTRHKGGGHKQHYRMVDFVRNKDGIPAEGRAPRVRPEPQRPPRARLLYADGERRYIIAPRGVAVGTTILSGAEAPIKAGNTLPLRNIPVGTTIHCVEMLPGKGAQIARSAGAAVQLLAREGTYAQLRLRSGEIRRVHVDCRATIGEVGNEEHSLRSDRQGRREALARHPPDGARRRDEPGRPPARRRRRPQRRRPAPVSPWGTPTKGYQTRNNKRTQTMIVARRKK